MTTSSAQRYQRSLDLVTGLAATFPPAAWGHMSPCPPWTARDLLGHLVDGQEQIMSMLRGHGPRPAEADTVAGAGPELVATWYATVQELTGMLADLDLDTVVPTPTRPRTVDELLTIGVIEPLIHAWDLATTIDRAIILDPEAVHATLIGVRALEVELAATGMYAAPVAIREGATEQERLLAATGRAPSVSAQR